MKRILFSLLLLLVPVCDAQSQAPYDQYEVPEYYDDLKLEGKPAGAFADMSLEAETLYASPMTIKEEWALHPERRDEGGRAAEYTIEPTSIIDYCRERPRRKYVTIDVESLNAYSDGIKNEYLRICKGACPNSLVTWWNFAPGDATIVTGGNLGDHVYWRTWDLSWQRKADFVKKMEWMNIGMYFTGSSDNYEEWHKRNKYRVEMARALLRDIGHDIPVFVTISPHRFQDKNIVVNEQLYGQVLDELARLQV
ncbi:MAG: hypothetical protein ACR2NP_06480, partial [Pirellulaceae bacterium]